MRIHTRIGRRQCNTVGGAGSALLLRRHETRHGYRLDLISTTTETDR